MNIHLGWGIRTWFFYKAGFGKKIQTVQSSRILSGRKFFLQHHSEGRIFGGLMPAETEFLCSLAVFLEARDVFEIGTCTGATSYNLARHIAGKVYTLDLPEEKSPSLQTEEADQEYMHVKAEDLFWNGKIESRKIVSLKGDSAKFDYTPYQNKMDLVFVDASHSYDYVCNDTEKALSLLKTRGAAVWHDYMPAWPGVVQALNEWAGRVRLYHIESTALVVYFTPELHKEIFGN